MQTTTTLIEPALLPLDVNSKRQKTDDALPFPKAHPTENYLTTLFDSFLGKLFPFQGLLLLDEIGQLIHSNPKARTLCHSLQQHSSTHLPENSLGQAPITLPQQVSTFCALLIEARTEFPGQPLQLREDIFLDNGLRVHLSAKWIDLEGQPSPCILVQLEDVTQIAGQRALCDACRYHFTPRETEVWALYLQGLSYQELGKQLFIAQSTVRKHMKSIHSKRRGELF